MERRDLTAFTVEPKGRAGLRVLVAEDHADCALSTALLLRACGHQVEIAPDGASALEAALTHEPDVVLLDIGLPGLDGWRVAEGIRAQAGGKRPLVIAVTGFGMPGDRRHSAESGVDLHLLKPVDPQALQGLLERFQQVIGN